MKDIVTISLATAANINMEANVYLSRRDFIKVAGVVAGSMALATCGDLPNTTPEPAPQPEKSENVSPFGVYLIGEARIGEIKSLVKQTEPNEETVSEIQKRVKTYVPEAKDGEVRVQMYDIVGTEGVLPFTIASIHDKKGQIMFAYTAFKVDEQGVQRSPIDGNVDIIYPLRDVVQEDGSHYVGIPDIDNKEIDLPMLFYISKDGKEVYFTPPFTDYSPTINPNGGIKVEAMPIALESPEPALPAEILELQKSLDGTNYGFGWNADLKTIALTYTNPETEKVSLIPEIVFDEKGNWKRTYTFETPYGTEAEVTIDSRVDKMNVIETPEGKKILDFSGWSLIDGKWVREYKQDTEVPNHNVAEAQFMIINNGSQDVKDGIHTNSSQFDTKENAKTYMNAMFPNINVTNGLINYQGVQDFRNAEAVMPIWFGPGIWLRDEDLKRVEVDTTFYVNMNLTSGDAAIIYRDKNREYQIIFINANLDDMRNWSPAFVVAHPFD